MFFNGSPEGSGTDSLDGEYGSGMVLSDDEDDTIPFYTSSIECELPYGRDQDIQDSGSNHVTLHLDMYETAEYSDQITVFPAPLQDHTRLYLQVGISGGQLRHDVVINQCWVQAADVRVHSVIDFR